jgi:hypothetical protein
LLCTATLDSSWVSGRDLLTIATGEIGVREKTGRNDGPEVEAYLARVGLKKGNPWCAAFVSWIFWKAGYSKPRSGWSPDLLPPSRRTTVPVPGAVLGIYFPEKKRIAHVGLVIRLQHDWVESVEGNTNVEGSREGGGVYKKLRHKRFVSAYSIWKNGKVSPEAGTSAVRKNSRGLCRAFAGLN